MQSRPRTLNALPVFPLPDYYLFPGTAAPLHIFENRYRQMTADLMDSPGRLVMSPYEPEGPLSDNGPVLPEIGTLTEIIQHEKLPDGRWLLLLLALGRVAVEETPSDLPYRLVSAETLPEDSEETLADIILREDLLATLRQRTDGLWEPPSAPPIGRLADVLLHALPLNLEQKRQAYFELDARVRANLALAWHRAAAAEDDD